MLTRLTHIPYGSSTAITESRSLTIPRSTTNRWGSIEIFLLIQTLSNSLLFIPESQDYRFAIRALPYAASILLALFYFNRARGRLVMPPGAGLLGAAMLLLALNLLHNTTVFPTGLAQMAFQLTIAAPALWVASVVETRERLERLLWLLFLTNGISTILGLLQVFYPRIFTPQFSSVALSLNSEAVRSLTYVGASGQAIVRPPGLSDIPGGAAIGGCVTALLGVLFGSQANQRGTRRLFCFLLAAAGMSIIYFTQIRALLLMLVLAVIGMCILLLRQTKFVQAAWIGGACALLITVTFAWAVTVGGKPLLDRFTSVTNQGVFESFQQNRGIFVKNTFEELAQEYPFGAGVGRWGMMSVYFPGDGNQAKPIWVEIQMTGWLLDGGILMWFFYGGAIVLSLLYVYRVSTCLTDKGMAYLASIVLCLNLFVVGLSFAGPTFNNQLGMQFWFLTGACYGVGKSVLPHMSHSRKEELV